MQKILTCLLFFIALFIVAPVRAMYQGNPFAPEMLEECLLLSKDTFMGFKVGFQHDQVFNRRLKVVSGAKGTIGECKILADQGVAVLNFFNRVELLGSAGGANFHVVETIRAANSLLEFQTHNGLIWGAGGRIALFNWRSITLGVSAGYEQSRVGTRYASLGGLLLTPSPRWNYHEWQMGLGISYKVDIFVPYIGATYSRARASLRKIPSMLILSNQDKVGLKNEENFGLTVGCDLTTEHVVDLGIEFRMFSEQAVTVKGDLKF